MILNVSGFFWSLLHFLKMVVWFFCLLPGFITYHGVVEWLYNHIAGLSSFMGLDSFAVFVLFLFTY